MWISKMLVVNSCTLRNNTYIITVFKNLELLMMILKIQFMKLKLVKIILLINILLVMEH